MQWFWYISWQKVLLEAKSPQGSTFLCHKWKEVEKTSSKWAQWVVDGCPFFSLGRCESLWEESPAKFCFEWQLVKIRPLQNLKSYLTIQMHHQQANANPGEVKKKLPTCRPRINEEFPKSFRAKMHTSYIPFQQKCEELLQISVPSLIWLLNKASGARSYTDTAICHSWWTKGLSQQWGRVKHLKKFPCEPWKASTTILTTEENPKGSQWDPATANCEHLIHTFHTSVVPYNPRLGLHMDHLSTNEH